MLNQELRLVSRPVGVPGPEHFALVSAPIAALAPGQVLVRNLLLSVDPAQRGYANDEGNYAPPVPLDSVMRSLAVGRIIDSQHPDHPVGQVVYGWFGWQSHCVCEATAILRVVRPSRLPLEASAGLLGINGLTAWLALHDIGCPRPGQTVVVTAAAGAVGSIVGQLAKAAGCRVVAVVGSAEKGKLCLARYGYDAWVDYHAPLAPALQQAAPSGVDIFFDNVGGPIADTVIGQMNLFGRVIQCGTLSTASWQTPPQGPRLEREVLTRRLRVEGFVIFDHQARFAQVADRLTAMAECGALQCDHDVVSGIEAAPQALVDVYAGRNRGKKLVCLRRDAA